MRVSHLVRQLFEITVSLPNTDGVANAALSVNNEELGELAVFLAFNDAVGSNADIDGINTCDRITMLVGSSKAFADGGACGSKMLYVL